MLGPLFCDLLAQAPLIPKLRGHFAEFLNNDSLASLRIFSSSTCVGLRYGRLYPFSNFSRQREFICFVTSFHSPSSPSLMTRVLHYVPASRFGHGFPSPCSDYPPVSLLHYQYRRYRNISTCCSSATTFVLTLVPDLPWVDKPSPGNLRHSTARILT